MYEHESFGRWLKRQRKARGLTQGELAHQAGCAVVTLRKIEADELRPSRQIALRLIEQLGVEVGERDVAVALARGERLPRRSNLPTPTTSLVGRREEVSAVCALLRGATRLLTLSGAPGIGKTRLGVQVAATLLDEFADGVFFVELAPITSPDLVLHTIAQVLGVQEHGALQLFHHLVDHLRGKQTLLVLDNFEHVLPSAPQIAELLTAVPTLRVLITSRSVLNLSGEQIFAVPPLALPKAAELSDEVSDLRDLLRQYPAIALFADRARAISPSFVLTEANVRVVAAICAELDGIPLAIELAATRSRMFSPPTLLARLEHRLDLLTRGAHDLPARQRTLRATIDWSYDLLDPEERVVFRRMAVFAGGCTLDAAETVVGEAPQALELGAPAPGATGFQSSIIDLVASLLDHSLLYQQPGEDGEPRFVMLGTVREYALSQLAESGELQALRERHGAYYLELVQRAEAELDSASQPYWLNRLEAEHNNLRAVLAWGCTSEGDPEVGLRMAAALWVFWQIRNYLSEGRAWLAALLEAAPTEPTLARARALSGAGFLARCQGDLPQAVALLDASLELSRLLRARQDIAHSLNNLAPAALDLEDYELVQQLCTESLALSRELDDKPSSAWALINLGHAARQTRRCADASRFYAEGLALFSELGSKRGIAHGLENLARMAVAQCDYRQAIALYQKSLGLVRELDDKECVARVLLQLGDIAQAEGNGVHAAALLDEGITLLRAINNKQSIGWALAKRGLVAEIRGDGAAAHACYAEGRHMCEQAGDQKGVARAIYGMGSVALLCGDGQAAYRLLSDYVALAQELRLERPEVLGTVLRAMALAAVEWSRGVALLRQHIAAFRTGGSEWGVCVGQHLLGLTLLDGAMEAEAVSCYKESLALAHGLNYNVGLPPRMAGLASVMWRQGKGADAARLCGAIEAMNETLGVGHVLASTVPADRAHLIQTLAMIQAQCEDPALAEAWADGRLMLAPAAVAYALTV